MKIVVQIEELLKNVAEDLKDRYCPTYITNDAEVEKINGEDYIYYYRFYFQTNTQRRLEQTAFALRWA